MIRKRLEQEVGKLSDAELAVIMEITTDDIKFNRVGFRKCTSLDYALDIAVKSALIFKKCA